MLTIFFIHTNIWSVKNLINIHRAVDKSVKNCAEVFYCSDTTGRMDGMSSLCYIDIKHKLLETWHHKRNGINIRALIIKIIIL